MAEFLSLLDPADLVALLLLFAAFYFYPALSARLLGEDIADRMKAWRHEWAEQIMWRHERITDVALVRGLIASVAFFASTTVLVISGLVALLGWSGEMSSLLAQYPHVGVTTPELFALKIMALLLLAISAFFKFVWSMRLHGYTLLMVGALPAPDETDRSYCAGIAERIAELSYLASKHYHDGVRAYYLGFSALIWIWSAWLFFPTLALVVLVMVRREYRSRSFFLSAIVRRQPDGGLVGRELRQ